MERRSIDKKSKGDEKVDGGENGMVGKQERGDRDKVSLCGEVIRRALYE